MDVAQYFKRVGIAISVLFNVVWGGYSNQTFSARNWAWYRKGLPNGVIIIDNIARVFMLITNFILAITRSCSRVDYTNHCLESWVYWRSRKDVLHDIVTNKLKD